MRSPRSELRIYFEQYETPDLVTAQAQSVQDITLRALSEKLKYQLMWQLRFLEEEMMAEQGIVKILKTSQVEISGFSPALTVKISAVLNDFE
jgi:hypothetical protein